jgi:ATP-dependent Clp protease protease subunit
MTTRVMPAAPRLVRHPNVSCDIAPRALERWNPELRAAAATDAEGDNKDAAIIAILDMIGADFFGQGITAKSVSAQLRNFGDVPVTVEINSPGGDYFEGLAIYNVLREHKQDITVKILGLAASAASVIAMAGDTIQVARAGFVMIHNVWVVTMGNRHDLRDVADWLEPFDQVAADLYAARTGLSVKEVAKLLDSETWIGGADAVEKGFADSLLPADQIGKAKNEAITGAVAAKRRLDLALAKGERLPRSQRRQLLNEISGTHDAAEDDTPSAVSTQNDLTHSVSLLEMGLARLKMVAA